MSFKDVKTTLTNYLGWKVQDIFYLISSSKYDYYIVYSNNKKIDGIAVVGNEDGIVEAYFK